MIDEEDSSFSTEEEVTFSELLANVMLNDEIIITIAPEDVERVKTGIKNTKAKQTAKMKEDGLPTNTGEMLSFTSTPSVKHKDMVDLKIILSRKSTVKIKALTIPDGDF